MILHIVYSMHRVSYMRYYEHVYVCMILHIEQHILTCMLLYGVEHL